MALKKIIAVLVMTFVLAADAVCFAADNKIIVYYFHGKVRCPTCHKMEQYTVQALDENFKNELASGLIVFSNVNVEDKENSHFIKEYKLFTKSLIISRQENGKEIKYNNLDKIWEYAGDNNKFVAYVTQEINSYLKDIDR